MDFALQGLAHDIAVAQRGVKAHAVLLGIFLLNGTADVAGGVQTGDGLAAGRQVLHLADLKGKSVVTSGSMDSFLSACQGPSLREMADVGVDLSKASPGSEGALIMIETGAVISIVPCLSNAVIQGVAKVPLLEVQSFIKIAEQKYARYNQKQPLTEALL